MLAKVIVLGRSLQGCALPFCLQLFFSLLCILLATGKDSMWAQQKEAEVPSLRIAFESAYQEALKLYLYNKYEASLEKIRSIFDQHKNHMALRMLAAFNYLALKNYPKAAAHAQIALREHPNRMEVSALYLRVLRARRKYSSALAFALRALRRFKGAVPLRLGLAAVYYEARQYRKAHRQLEYILAQEPQNFYAIYMDGLIFLQQGRYESAQFRLANALHIKSANQNDMLMLYNNLGVVYEKQAELMAKKGLREQADNYYTQARRYYHYALEIRPEDPIIQANQARIEP